MEVKVEVEIYESYIVSRIEAVPVPAAPRGALLIRLAAVIDHLHITPLPRLSRVESSAVRYPVLEQGVRVI